MSKLNDILEFNAAFVNNKEYVKYATCKNLKKKMVILSCMDARLTDLLPKALNIKNGDAKIIKNAGATVMHPFGSIIRSVMVAIYEFNADEIFVIGHTGCGMCNLNTDNLMDKIYERGISRESIETLYNGGIDVKSWLHGFDSVDESVTDSVNVIKKHPLMPKGIAVHGLVIDPATGKLDVIINGYEK